MDDRSEGFGLLEEEAEVLGLDLFATEAFGGWGMLQDYHIFHEVFGGQDLGDVQKNGFKAALFCDFDVELLDLL